VPDPKNDGDDTDRIALDVKARTEADAPEQWELGTFNADGRERIFPARAVVGLTLTIDGAEFRVAPGDVKSFELHLASWGWEGTLEFIVVDDQPLGGPDRDKLREKFVGPKLIEVALSLQSGWTNNAKEIRPAVTLRGIAHERTLQEIQQHLELAAMPVVMRRYTLRVTDPMRALWGQHFPSVLYADATMKQVLDEHKGDRIALAYEWPELEVKRPIIFVGLDPSSGPASFYDYVMWFVARHNGVFTYDLQQNRYALRAAKKDAGAPFDVYWQDVERSTHRLPAPPRYTPTILNSYTERPVTATIANSSAAASMVRATLLRTPVDDEVARRKALETTRLIAEPKPTLELELRSLPAAPLFPGDLAAIAPGKTAWNAKTWAAQQKNFRVFEVRWRGQAPGGERVDHANQSGHFLTSLKVQLELVADPRPRLPAFVEHEAPTFVEGKIVSEVGADDEKTHEPYPAEPQPRVYHVLVPLWNRTIITPYEPLKLPGQLHFPAHKHQRVLMAFTWRRAWIESFLDWRDGIERPTDAQANHLLLGKKPDSITSVLHDYEDAKPVFRIARTHRHDLQSIKISEGNLHIEVKEEP